MEAKQLNIFDVLRGLADESSETYRATIKILTNFPKDLPPPDDGYIPSPFSESKQAPKASNGIRIPNPPPKAISWLSRNWPWLVLGGLVIGIIIYLFVRNKRKKKEEEFRRREGEHLPTINYPEPSEASSPIIKVTAPSKALSIEEFFEELEHAEDAKKMEEPPASEPASNDASPTNIEKNK